ncbi:hypothetical protein E4U60_006233 [Claviceps pazoutovae]|uniref:Cysteine-rich transmembrane domain-containing protein n=1 Tax=Claviceps pazoutovae TaxID=1649127 RepID=A0A9P7MJ87_9HYPO|nr:hypothetical protein E4U60_006233 [Claviceps pazoutovae]
MSSQEYYQGQQGGYPQHPQQVSQSSHTVFAALVCIRLLKSLGLFTAQKANRFHLQSYGPPQGQYPPPQGQYYGPPQGQQPMQYQQAPPQDTRGKKGGSNNCLIACLAAICCCCAVEEGCECCIDCCECLL